jgi:hypothetical protein
MQATANKFITEFRIEDVDHARWLPCDASTMLEKLNSKSAIWTGWVNGQVLAICGITTVHPHYAKCWTYLHPDVRKHRYWLHRSVKKILHNYVRANAFFRVDAECYETHVEAGIWLDRLGLKAEGRMPFYGPQGETMIRHAWYPRGLHG